MAMVLLNPYISLWQSNAVISPINKAEDGETLYLESHRSK